MSDLANTGRCRPSEGRCITPEGTLIWQGHKLSNICACTYKGNYRASFSSPFFIVESIQAALKIKGKQQYPCSDIPFAYTTNQGILMKFGSTVSDDNKESFKKHNATMNPYPDIAQYTDAINSKLNFLEAHILDSERENFRLLWMQLCA